MVRHTGTMLTPRALKRIPIAMVLLWLRVCHLHVLADLHPRVPLAAWSYIVNHRCAGVHLLPACTCQWSERTASEPLRTKQLP